MVRGKGTILKFYLNKIHDFPIITNSLFSRGCRTYIYLVGYARFLTLSIMLRRLSFALKETGYFKLISTNTPKKLGSRFRSSREREREREIAHTSSLNCFNTSPTWACEAC
jgi:hypothetical protein